MQIYQFYLLYIEKSYIKNKIIFNIIGYSDNLILSPSNKSKLNTVFIETSM